MASKGTIHGPSAHARIYAAKPQAEFRPQNGSRVGPSRAASQASSPQRTSAERDSESPGDVKYQVITGAMVGVVLAIVPPGGHGDSFEPADLADVGEALGILDEQVSRR